MKKHLYAYCNVLRMITRQETKRRRYIERRIFHLLMSLELFVFMICTGIEIDHFMDITVIYFTILCD